MKHIRHIATIAITSILFMWIALFPMATYLESSDPVIIKTNQVRAQYGLRPLREDRRLDVSATRKACDLRDRNYWSHYAPDGTTPWSFFIKAGYYYTSAGENLARNFSDTVVVNAWMASPTHKDIMLRPEYRDMGVGRCGIFVVGHYAR